MAKDGDGILIIGPIDQHPAPYHNGEYREIDPVRPPHEQRMFFFDNFHQELCSTKLFKIIIHLEFAIAPAGNSIFEAPVISPVEVFCTKAITS